MLAIHRQHPASAGFSLVELLVAVALIGLSLAVVAPNLSGLVPSARLEGSSKELRSQLVMIRSEARIQAKRMELELDLDRELFRVVYPPEEQLTTDREIVRDNDLNDDEKDWIELEPDVDIVGAGDAVEGLAEKGTYRVTFDEYGFSGDQVIVLRLKSDPDMVLTMSIRGLTGKIESHRSDDGEVFKPVRINEGAF